MLEKAQAALVVIDFQDGLLPKIPVADAIVPQAARLIRCLKELGVPIVCTEQYPKGLGRTTESIAQALGEFAPIEKTSFGCLGEPAFADAVASLERSQLVVIGVETHVCVLQTVLRAQAQGFSCYVVEDATASRSKRDHKAGLARMQAHGADIVTSEMAIFELLGCAGTADFKRLLPLIK